MSRAQKNALGKRGAKPSVLFISYTGLLEPLGQSQVIAYQELLSADRSVHVVSFEKPHDLADRVKVEAMQVRTGRAGIHWHPRRYHKRPSLLGTCWDIAVGTWVGWRLARGHGLGIVHARSYVAGVMGLLVKRLTGARFLFDMRGFWVDERVDGGLWPRGGWLYRFGKRVERRLLSGADHVVSLTHAAVGAMRSFDFLQVDPPPMTVIPTCTDLERFVPMDGWRVSDGFTLGYVGSVGTWYLFDEAVAVFSAVRAKVPKARFLIVNREEHAYIRERLTLAGIAPEAVELYAAAHQDVPAMMARMDAAVFLIKPVFSKLASAPTRLGEFLGCGIPCLANTGVGDMAEILREDRVGVAVRAMDGASLAKGVTELLALCSDPDIRRRCVESARRRFSLESGAARYEAIYRSLKGSRYA